MTIARPPAGASNGEIVRWTFAVLDAHDVAALPTMWTDAIATNFVVFDQMQFARQLGRLPSDGSRADRATKAAFNAKTRLLARVRRR